MCKLKIKLTLITFRVDFACEFIKNKVKCDLNTY